MTSCGPDPAPRPLIVNADDFGLTIRTSHTIALLHEHGIVTSTSALVLAPGFEPTAHLIAGHPTMGVGIHLCLVGPDPALCPARDIPTLVDRRGRLARSWHLLMPRLVAGLVDPADVERELAAQIDLALACGLQPGHLDSHQHLHLWPTIAEVVIRLALRYRIPALRCPQSHSLKAERVPVTLLSRNLRALLAASGLATTERFAGLDESGRAVADRFDRVMAAIPGGVATLEFGVHPSDDDDPDRGRYPWRHQGSGEAVGLCRSGLRPALAAAGWRLATFADLAPTPAPTPVIVGDGQPR